MTFLYTRDIEIIPETRYPDQTVGNHSVTTISNADSIQPAGRIDRVRIHRPRRSRHAVTLFLCLYWPTRGSRYNLSSGIIVKKETELVVTKSQGEIEQFEHFEKYVTFILLLPIEANLKEIFNSIIDECNTYGNFLSENIIITNVKKLSIEEIDDFLKSKSPKHKSRPF